MLSIDIRKYKWSADALRWIMRAPPYANGLMVVLVAYTFAIITWKLVPKPPVGEIPDIAIPSATQSANFAQPVNNLRNLSAFHLFGEATIAPIAEPELPSEAPDTSLSLTLMGVIAGGPRAWAIIADRMNNEETYTVNSPLPGGATLKEIYPDRVILLFNNRYETLRLPQDDMTGVEGNSPLSAAPSRFAPSGPTTHLGAEATQILKGYRQQLINDPQSLMDVVRAEPYRVGGQIKGYRIFPGRDKRVMDQVGLMPGDVVTGINGIELDSPLKGLEVMQQVTDASQVSVNVLRNGVNQTFVVPLN